MHKIVFTTGTLPRRVVFWGIFFQFLRIVSLPILSSCYVFYVSQFLENHSITSHQFVLQMYLVLPWGLFWGYDILFLRAVLPYLMKFCTYVICITMGLILGIVLSVLRNLRDFFDILHRCLDIIVLVTKLKNLLGFHLLWTFAGFFRLFCSMFLKW